MRAALNWRNSSIDEARQSSSFVNVCSFNQLRLAFDVQSIWAPNEMLRIHKKANGEVVFALSGRFDEEGVGELDRLLGEEGKDRQIILDLKDMTLTGQDGIAFLVRCEAAGIELANCDPYVREWMTRQGTGT